MPECDAMYLVTYLFDAGPTEQGAMGESPLSHGEMLAWMSNTGIELDAWEARMVRQLSMSYLSEKQRAVDASLPPPWADAPYGRADPATQAKRLQQHIERLAK